jgi:integrase
MAGVDIKTVSERLGHADVKTTLDTYAHVLPGRDAFAADVFSQVTGSGARW